MEIHRLSVVLFFLTVCLALAVVWTRISTVKATYLYVQQERELRKLQEDIQRAKVAWLKLTAPKHLESLAKSLQLSPPTSEQVFRYRSP